MKTKTIILPFLFILILSSIVLVKADLSTNLTITADKQIYNKYDQINLSGTLQSNGISPSDGLVGVQIQYPNGNPIILRTIQTGTVAVFNLPEKVSSAYSSDLVGNPVGSFQNGATAYFTTTVTDQDSTMHDGILVAISIYDSNGVSLGLNYHTVTIGAGATQTSTVSIPIPTAAHAGTCYGYADVYTDWPANGGVPMAQEQSFQFTISGGYPASGSPPINSGDAGAYSMTFKLPKNIPSGTYNVYSTAMYSGLKGTSSTSFTVKLLGDFNGDGKVDANDLFIFMDSYISYYQGGGFNSACDMNNDGKVNADDFFMFLGAYIQYWSA